MRQKAILWGISIFLFIGLACAEENVCVADTIFSSNRGYYDEPFNLTISCATPGASVVYTTDGSIPSLENGVRLRQNLPVTFRISGTTIVRAIAVKEGWETTDVDTHTYLFRDQVLRQKKLPGFPENLDVEMDPRIVGDSRFVKELSTSFLKAPSISLVMPVEDLFGPKGIDINAHQSGPDWKRATSMEWIDPVKGKTHQIDCGIQIQGASSRKRSPKHNFRLSFKAKYGSRKLRLKFFKTTEVAEFDSLVLRSPTHDSWTVVHPGWRNNARYVNDAWAVETQRLMGHPVPHRRWVHLYFNGLYWGLYALSERPDEHFAAAHLGGKPSEYDVLNAGNLRHGTKDNFQKALALAQSPEIATREGYQAMLRLLDMEAFIDYFLYNIYACNIDWPNKNYWIAGRRSEEPKFRFLNWDAEIGFFQKWEHSRNPNRLTALEFDQLSEHNAFLMDTHGAGYFFLRLKRNFEFRRHLADRLHLHTQPGGLLSPESAAKRYRTLLDEIEPLLSLEAARWGDLYTDKPYHTKTKHWKELTSETSWLFKEFFPNRASQVCDHFMRAGFVRQKQEDPSQKK